MTKITENFWKHLIPSPQQAVSNSELKSLIESLLSHIADVLGLSDIARIDAIKTMFEVAENETDELVFEQIVKEKLVGKCDRTKLNLIIQERSSIIYEEIKSHLQGQTLLDIGCGNGLISEMARQNFSEVQLLDVVNYINPDVKLPFMSYHEGENLPVDRMYDTVLLLTVLHHTNDPLTLLKEAWKVTNKRLIIIESIFGVHEKLPNNKYKLADHGDREQIAFAVFVDWLYNRVLHDNIPVPYNFTTPQKWIEIFTQLEMRLVESINLGQDIEIAPELHYLFVLTR